MSILRERFENLLGSYPWESHGHVITILALFFHMHCTHETHKKSEVLVALLQPTLRGFLHTVARKQFTGVSSVIFFLLDWFSPILTANLGINQLMAVSWIKKVGPSVI